MSNPGSCAAPEGRLRSHLFWKVFAALVTAIAVAWVLWLLIKVWPNLAAHSAQLRMLPLMVGLVLSVAAAWFTFEAFAILARIFRGSSLPRSELANLYFVAQLLKHLPGRVWGIGYQWAAASSEVTLGRWVLINLSHMLLATFFALWAACLVLTFWRGVAWGLVAVASVIVACGVGLWLMTARRAWRWLNWLPDRAATLGRDMLGFALEAPLTAWVWIFFLLSISSLFYYASWFLYGISYPPLGGSAGIRLCALYMLAWFVGYVSLLTPSGLGVRELVFAWLAKDFPGDSVALMALVGRGSLLCVDVILGLAFSLSAPKKP